MAKRKQVQLTIEQYEDALRKAGGFISYAAKSLNVSPSAVTQRVKANEHLQQVLREVKDSYLDLSEAALLKKIKAGDLGAICFYLKCQGKDRGYVEKQQIEASSPDGKPLKFNIEFVGSDASKNSDS